MCQPVSSCSYVKNFRSISSPSCPGRDILNPDWQKEAWISQNPASLESTAQVAAGAPPPSPTKGCKVMHILTASQKPQFNQRFKIDVYLERTVAEHPMSQGGTQKVAAGPTWAYSGLGHPRGCSNSPKPPLNHLCGALRAAPAGSRRCDNHPCPSWPPRTAPVPTTATGNPPRSLT